MQRYTQKEEKDYQEGRSDALLNNHLQSNRSPLYYAGFRDGIVEYMQHVE